MVIFLVKIENEESLALNEFFDYNGKCYALSKSREDAGGNLIKMDDFFEASVGTKELKDVMTVFTTVDDGRATILGWYKESIVYSELIQPSLFLEGNIVANASDVVLLPAENRLSYTAWTEKQKGYEIVEIEDARFDDIYSLVYDYKGENAFVRYPFAEAKLIPSALKSKEACNEACEYYASNILNNTCKGIAEIKLLEAYGKKLTEMDSKSADGYYYMAMARCHLGFAKKGIKDIEKALKLEPDASDLIAQKGMLLCSMGHDLAAAECFDKAYEVSHDESYLLLEGVALIRGGELDTGCKKLKEIQDEELLIEAGIEIRNIEKKKPFSGLERFFLKR